MRATIPRVGDRILADQPYEDLLDAFAARAATPGGGSAAALAAAMAAALVERCAAVAGDRAGAGAERTLQRAGELRRALVAIADDDAAALRGLVASLRTGDDANADDRAETVAAASRPPALLREAAAEVASLAASLERCGAPRLRGEARCAMLLADAAVGAADAIIRINQRLESPAP